MDPSVAPGDDFFRYTNGGWLKKTEIPPDRSSYGTWEVLIERAQQRTRMLLDEAAAETPDDRTFFISFGQTWRSKEREEYARQLVLADGHALNEYRASTVRNLDPWYTAFDAKPGQRLYLSPADRVRVW